MRGCSERAWRKMLKQSGEHPGFSSSQMRWEGSYTADQSLIKSIKCLSNFQSSMNREQVKNPCVANESLFQNVLIFIRHPKHRCLLMTHTHTHANPQEAVLVWCCLQGSPQTCRQQEVTRKWSVFISCQLGEC